MNTARYYLALFLVVVMLPMPLFWFVIHPFIQVWRKAGPVVTYVVASSIWLGAAVALFLVRKDLLRIEYGTHSSSIMLGAVCLGFAFWMRLRIHRQVPNKFFAGLPELAPEVHPGRLVTEGIYGRIRPPRYVQIMVALLSDAGHAVIKAYGAWGTKKMYGKEFEGVVRSTVLIDPKGVVSALYHIPVSLIRAVIRVESDFDPHVVSRAGAQGLMQLMPAVARGMGVTDVFDPRQNIFGGTRFLRILANTFAGDLVLTISGYHAGPEAVRRYGGIPPYQTTQKYVRWVLAQYYREQRLLARR